MRPTVSFDAHQCARTPNNSTNQRAKGRFHAGDVNVDGRIILIWMIKKFVWTGFDWLKFWKFHFSFHMRRIFLDQLSDYQHVENHSTPAGGISDTEGGCNRLI